MSAQATVYIRDGHPAATVVSAKDLVAGQNLHDAAGEHHPIKSAQLLKTSVLVVREDEWVDYFNPSDTVTVCPA